MFFEPFLAGPNTSPGAIHNEGRDAPLSAELLGGIFVYQDKAQPTPGASSYAFETLILPLVTEIGAGTAVRQLRMVTQTPSVYQQQALRTNGYGGLVAGTPALTPLSGDTGGFPNG